MIEEGWRIAKSFSDGEGKTKDICVCMICPTLPLSSVSRFPPSSLSGHGHAPPLGQRRPTCMCAFTDPATQIWTMEKTEEQRHARTDSMKAGQSAKPSPMEQNERSVAHALQNMHPRLWRVALVAVVFVVLVVLVVVVVVVVVVVQVVAVVVVVSVSLVPASAFHMPLRASTATVPVTLCPCARVCLCARVRVLRRLLEPPQGPREKRNGAATGTNQLGSLPKLIIGCCQPPLDSRP
eukprot:GHVU01039166.1.p2 GENE.GHVU01039166.1~~GHVU01039166.1.p2  ORF type:complete len:237 (+),score=10.63 GHVU01039166.1:52-762(+)